VSCEVPINGETKLDMQTPKAALVVYVFVPLSVDGRDDSSVRNLTDDRR